MVRQHVQRKAGSVAGKTLSLFAEDTDLQGWRYGAMLTDLTLPGLGGLAFIQGTGGL